MILLANFMIAIAQVLNLLLDMYFFILIARAVISWIGADPYNPIVRFICSITDPLLYKIRRKIPFNIGPVDFTPIILIAIIYFLKLFLVQSVSDYGHQLKHGGSVNKIVREMQQGNE